eukprot:321854-Amphidinium_carterae.2
MSRSPSMTKGSTEWLQTAQNTGHLRKHFALSMSLHSMLNGFRKAVGHEDSHSLFECHLPGFVPLGAIESIIIRKGLYDSHSDIKAKAIAQHASEEPAPT